MTVTAFHATQGLSRVYCGHNAHILMFSSSEERSMGSKNDNEKNNKKRIISPNDISSLFDNKSIRPSSTISKNSDEDDAEEDEYFGYEEDEEDDDEGEEEKTDDVSEPSPGSDSEYTSQLLPSSSIFGEERKPVLTELDRLQRMMSKSSSSSYDSESPTEKPPTFEKSPLKEYSDEEMEYTNLEAALDKRSQKVVLEELSMASPSSQARNKLEIGPRTVKYDPSERDWRVDPMQFGAYRRWKVPVENTKKLTKGSSQPKSSRSAAEKFYDAIKNLSSGPTGAVCVNNIYIFDDCLNIF